MTTIHSIHSINPMPSSPALIATSSESWPHITVNGVAIATEAIAREMQYHPADSREEAVFLAAQALVIRELLQQRADALHLSIQPQENESEEEALIRCLLAAEVQIPEPDEASLRQVYQASPAQFHSAPLLAARHILFAAVPEDAIERSQQREAALAVIAQLNAGADFGQMARQHSACPSKTHGGALGQLSAGQTVPEFERQLFRLPIGLSLQPLESRYGFHVVQVDQRVDGEALPFEVVAPRIRDQLTQRSAHKAVVHYLHGLAGSAQIEGIQLKTADSLPIQ